MYREHIRIASKARYGAISNRPPDVHDLISRHAGSEEQQVNAWRAHIDALFADSVRMEEDTIRKYEYLISEIKIMPVSTAVRARIIEVLEHIKQEEVNHLGLLRRVKG